MSLTSAAVVKRSAGLMSASIDDEIVILNPSRDNYIGLDEIGRRVWELLSEPILLGDLSHQVVREYHGNPQQISADLMAFLQELHSEGLLQVEQ